MCFFKRKKYAVLNADNKESPSIIEAKRKKSLWLFLANIWRVIDYGIAILSFGASMAVVYIETNISIYNKWIISILSISAAVLMLISFAIEPKKHIRNYRTAYTRMYSALWIYRDSQDYDKIIAYVLSQCEKIIDSSYDVDTHE